MTTDKNTSGFSALVGIIILLVVAGIGIGGWYVWQKGHKNTSKDSTPQTSNHPSVQPADPSENGKYLVIKEWGVRVPLPEELRGDIYYKASVSEVGSQSTAFASKKLDTLVGGGYCTFRPQADGKAYGIGISASLSRINPDKPGEETINYYRSQHTFIKKIGNYEYSKPKPKDPPITCLTNSEEQYGPTEQSISNQLNASFEQMEAY